MLWKVISYIPSRNDAPYAKDTNLLASSLSDVDLVDEFDNRPKTEWSFIFIFLFDAHYTQFQRMYRTGSETIANMNHDTKTSNENTNRHWRIK